MNTQRVEGHTPRTMGELVMQHAKRDTMSTDEGCRMLELPDAAENFCAANTYLSALSTIRRLEKVNEALVELAELVKRGLDSGHIKAKPIITMDPDAESLPVKCLEDFVDAALALAKEPA